MERLALVVMVIGYIMKFDAARFGGERWTGLSGLDKPFLVVGRSGMTGQANLFVRSHNDRFVTLRELMESRGIQLFN